MMNTKPKPVLSLFDSTCLIVGIVIGAGIYQMAPDVAKGAGNGWGVLAIWVLGGILSLCGALSYAELAAAYPQEGGDYVYLSRAYGPWAGFLFAWAQLTIVRPGDIAVMAFAFATYARTICDPLADTAFPYSRQIYAVAATLAFTLINLLGVRKGKWAQNLLTMAKVLGLLLVVGAAFLAPPASSAAESFDPLPFRLSLIFVLFTYGGWNEMAYVAAEVKNPHRNIVRAILLGALTVTALYLAINIAFLYTLGYQGLATSKAVGVDAVAGALPTTGGMLISILVCISALGAVNGLIFTGARISYAVGAQSRLFRFLGDWDARRATPTRALLLQGAIAVALILALGSFVNAVLYTAATVYSFYLGTTLAVLVLRHREPDVERPYRVVGYPFTPLVFALVCLFLIHSAVTHTPWIALAYGGVLLLGLVAWRFDRKPGAPSAQDGLARKRRRISRHP